MGFVNDYLTDEEQELFRKKAVHYGNPSYRERCGILGYEPYSKVKCTVDREKQIYFFDLGYKFFEEDHYKHGFGFVWDDMLGKEVIFFELSYKFTFNEEFDLMWKGNIKLPDQLYNGEGVSLKNIMKAIKETMSNKHDKKSYQSQSKPQIILDKIKEAMQVYGLRGEPGVQAQLNIGFDI